jgi:hypothetical protein
MIVQAKEAQVLHVLACMHPSISDRHYGNTMIPKKRDRHRVQLKKIEGAES